jgi:Ca2+-binding RTX toxin-like protein
MSSSTTRRRLVRKAVATGLLTLAGVLFATSTASADVRCRYKADTQTILVTVLGDNPDGSISKLRLCGPADAQNVVIRSARNFQTGADHVLIEAPEQYVGKHFTVDLFNGWLFLVGDGTNPVDYTIGQDGVNFGNGDGVDLSFAQPIGNLFVWANAGGGTISGQGGAGTGDPSTDFLVLAAGRVIYDPYPFVTANGTAPTTILGGDNFQGDELIGAGGDDVIRGYAGPDSISGQRGNDTLDGGDGNDFMKGSAGDDDLTGGAGQDFMSGGRGTDALHAVDGEADTVDGGPGSSDSAEVDAGVDIVKRVELVS